MTWGQGVSVWKFCLYRLHFFSQVLDFLHSNSSEACIDTVGYNNCTNASCSEASKFPILLLQRLYFLFCFLRRRQC